uniref:Uncharacterized protein n=1 Tax=Orbilia brochopaga TaxID=3140254 RepID=A0A4Y5MV66_9PEZI|nr:hypothetical protein [Drechslerella brochopaga]
MDVWSRFTCFVKGLPTILCWSVFLRKPATYSFSIIFCVGMSTRALTFALIVICFPVVDLVFILKSTLFRLLICAPRKSNPSFICVINGFDSFSSSPVFSHKYSFICFFISVASFIGPSSKKTKSSAYLMYMALRYVGSIGSFRGMCRINFRACCLSNSVAFLFLGSLAYTILLYFLLVRLLSPVLCEGRISSEMYLSNSCSTTFANSGLRTLPWGVPMLEVTIFPFIGSLYPTLNVLFTMMRNLWHFIFWRRIFKMISWGILSKHLDISPWMTHVYWCAFRWRICSALCVDFPGLKPWEHSKNVGS